MKVTKLRVLLAAAVVAGALLPAVTATAKEQRFSVMCETTDRSFRDPSLAATGERIDISDHLHQFFGNKNDSVTRPTLRAMRRSGTACELSGDTATY